MDLATGVCVSAIGAITGAIRAYPLTQPGLDQELGVVLAFAGSLEVEQNALQPHTLGVVVATRTVTSAAARD